MSEDDGGGGLLVFVVCKPDAVNQLANYQTFQTSTAPHRMERGTRVWLLLHNVWLDFKHANHSHFSFRCTTHHSTYSVNYHVAGSPVIRTPSLLTYSIGKEKKHPLRISYRYLHLLLKSLAVYVLPFRTIPLVPLNPGTIRRMPSATPQEAPHLRPFQLPLTIA